MARNDSPWLGRHLRELSRAFVLWIEEEYEFVVVCGMKLPPGYNRAETQLLIEIPQDYPLSPPGVGADRVYLSPDLRFKRRKLKDLHTGTTPSFYTPGFGPWAWFCYERVEWSPSRDGLVTFVEMVRADLTDPRTHRSLFS